MARIHFIIQGKGGVGKSFIASTIAQYLIDQGAKPLCIDTDPVNATFHGYASLGVQRLEIMEGNEINSRRFDTLVELIAGAKGDIIVDNGASSFTQLSSYLVSNAVPQLFESMGHELVIHTVVTGGQAMLDTLNGLDQLTTHFPDAAQFVVWLNPYWGPIEHEGKPFEQMGAYKKNKHRIQAIIKVPELKQETFGRDLSDLLQARQTFKEAIDSPALTIMSRQRLALTRDGLYKALSVSGMV